MYSLPETLRKELARPMAPVLTTAEAVAQIGERFLVSVGDVCTEKFLEAGVTPDVCVVDGRTQRGPEEGARKKRLRDESVRTWVHVKNPAGVITKELWHAVTETIVETREGAATREGDEGVRPWAAGRRAVVEVEGEEDLAVLPAVLATPVGGFVAYGQPPGAVYGEAPTPGGVALIEVNDAARRRVHEWLSKMESS